MRRIRSRFVLALAVIGVTAMVGCTTTPGAAVRGPAAEPTKSTVRTTPPPSETPSTTRSSPTAVSTPVAPSTTDSGFPTDDLGDIVTGVEKALYWRITNPRPAGWTETDGNANRVFRTGGCLITFTQSLSDETPEKAMTAVDEDIPQLIEAYELTSVTTKVEPMLMLQVIDTDLTIGFSGQSFTSDQSAGAYWAYVSGRYALTAYQLCPNDEAGLLESEIYPWLRTNSIELREPS